MRRISAAAVVKNFSYLGGSDTSRPNFMQLAGVGSFETGGTSRR
jgi:hypothetical protein